MKPPEVGTVTPERDDKLAEAVSRLVSASSPERIYLFGSMARGDSGPDSDYDLLLIVPDDVPDALRNAQLAYRVLWGTGVAADVIVQRRCYFESRKHIQSSLPATILREGKLLYAA